MCHLRNTGSAGTEFVSVDRQTERHDEAKTRLKPVCDCAQISRSKRFKAHWKLRNLHAATFYRTLWQQNKSHTNWTSEWRKTYRLHSDETDLTDSPEKERKIILANKFNCHIWRYRMIKKSLCTWQLHCNHQMHRNVLITLY